jgi:capsular exopolysaccharide synthesis family protein
VTNYPLPQGTTSPTEISQVITSSSGAWTYPPQGPALEAEPDVEFWDLVRRNAVLIGAGALLAAVAAAVVTSQLTPVYEATASIRIDQKSSQLPALNALGVPGGNAVATELEMLRSRGVAEQVVDSLKLQLQLERPRGVATRAVFSHAAIARSAPPGEYQLIPNGEGAFELVEPAAAGARVLQLSARVVKPGERLQLGDSVALELAPGAADHGTIAFRLLPFDEAVDAMQAAVAVERRNRDADIVDVRYRSDDPERARAVVNTLARRFIDGRQDVRQLDARSTVGFLREQVDRVAGQLASSEQELRRFRDREQIISLPDEASTGVSRLAELQAQRNALDVERGALTELLRAPRPAAAAADAPAGGNRDLVAFPTLLRTAAASNLVASLTAAEDRRNELLARRTPQDPDVQIQDQRIAQLHRDIESLVGTYLQGLTNQVAALDSTLTRSNARLRSIPAKEIRLAELERNAQGNAAVYSMLQTRLKEAEVAAAVTDQSVRLVDAAVLPRVPVSPKPLVNVFMALIAGGMLGLAGAFAREHGDRSLHTRAELLAVAGVPALGFIPSLSARRAWPRALLGFGPRPPALAAPEAKRSPGVTERRPGAQRGDRSGPVYETDDLFVFAEAHSRLATNLAFIRSEPALRVLAVTSALPNDGKTTIATNFAATLAREGKRTLLIDADLRGGRVGDVFHLGHGPGLCELLSGHAQLPQVVRRVAVGGDHDLHVITRGAVSRSPTQQLGSQTAHDLIEWARATYDVVVIDTPPVNIVADASVLAPLTDGLVLVVRAGVTAREAVAFAMEQLRIVRAPVVGAVLNDVDPRRDGAYNGGYQYYGQYGTPAA